MNKPDIKRPRFDKALKRIQDFSRHLPANPQFEKFETEGWFFGLNDYHVSGAKMNDFVGKLQERLAVVNGVFHSIIKEFSAIYEVFNALDKEYVAGILSSLNKAHQAIIGAQRACDGNTLTLDKLKKTVEKLLQVSSEFSEFKATSSSRLGLLEQQLLVLDKCFEDIAQLRKHQDSFEKQYKEVAEFITFLRKKNIVDDIKLLQASINDHKLSLQDLSDKQANDTYHLDSKLDQQEQAMKSWMEEMLVNQKIYRKKIIVAYIIAGMSLVLSITSICLSSM